MKIKKSNALRLWEEFYGEEKYAEDFHGNLMCREGYGDDDFFVWEGRTKIYCGWNIHHVLPVTCGGTNAKSNLICTNIATNYAAADKITYWIDDCLYQVKRVQGTGEYEIVQLS